jgi:hypothetical protein
MRVKKLLIAPAIALAILTPFDANADFFGGDIPLLTQILAETIQQLAQLQQIFGTGQDTLGLLRDINSGVRNGLAVVQLMNPRFQPGIYGNLYDADRALNLVQDLYGRVPDTAEYRLQSAQDQSVADSLAMHGSLYAYADRVDEKSQEMLMQAQVVNPQGAGKLQAQSLAVLIGVTTQLLRTNSAMLKLMAENMALSNRKEKLSAEQFRNQYDGLGSAFSNLPKDTKLPVLGE